MEDTNRIKELRQLLSHYNHLYYVLDCSPITDQEYDKLYWELTELEKKHPELFDSCSPTQRVGAEVSSFQKVKHLDGRMLSLSNMRTAEEVIRYLGTGEEVVVEPKIDGVSLKLIYKKGRLVQAITRGNGMEGDDVTASARAVMSIPLVLKEPVTITVVGEVYMTYTVFNALNAQLEKEGQDLMANPRNSASGGLKLKDPGQVVERKLQFVAYGSTTEIAHVPNHIQLLDHLDILGFRSTFNLPVKQSCQSITDCFVIKNAHMLRERIEHADRLRACLDLATDGLVFKLNSFAAQRERGEGTKYPNYACAFKFPPERKSTMLLGVTLQVGRTGKITPVAELKPVALSGTVVKRASLCNQEEIMRLRVDSGDTVIVEKSAEIIPKVVGVVWEGYSFINGTLDCGTSGGPSSTERAKLLASFSTKPCYTLPDKCPCCETTLFRPQAYVDTFCPNSDCDDQVFERLRHACGKAALDIDGCGDVLVRGLMERGVRKLSDLFKIDTSFMKPAVRKRFEAGRKAAMGQPLWRKLHALGIDGFGQVYCQEVAARWSSLSNAFDDPAEFRELVGESVFKNIIDYCGKEADEITLLDRAIIMSTVEEVTGPLKGKSICITGDLESGSRNEVSRRIEAAGGIYKSSVTKHLSYLVQGTETGRNKRQKAEKYGIPVITEKQLYELMGQEVPLPSNDIEEKEY